MYRSSPIILLLIAAFAVAACTHVPQYRTCSGSVWTTSYSITYRSDTELNDSISAILADVDASLSPFNPHSLVSAINSGNTACTDSLLREMIVLSQQVCSISHGLFDPSVAPLVNLWGFGYRKAKEEAPDSATVAATLPLVGIGGCSLAGDTLVKGHPQMEFNFSAIAKGYACDLVGRMLRRNGVTDFLVEIGGEIVASGINPHSEPWHVQIDAPNPGLQHERLMVVALTDCALATSGNYRNFRHTDSLTVWHTIDPTTGYPAVTTTLSATVRAPQCALADALATACMAMTPQQAIDMIATVPSASCMLVVASRGNSEFDIIASPDFTLE